MTRFLGSTAILLALASTANADTSAAFGAVEFGETDFYASELIGSRIYNSEEGVSNDTTIADGGEAEWDDIGEINDLIVTQDGSVSAVILGIGGFLGIGERDIAISMDEITVVRDDGEASDRFFVVSASREALEAAPAFERDDEMAEDGAVQTGQSEAADAEQSNAAAKDTMETADQREMLTKPAVERDGYIEADAEMIGQLTTEDLEGAYVYGADDETVGEIDALVLGDGGAVDRVVINVGGFLGIGEKPVAVTFDELQVLRTEDGSDVRIYIDSTQDALEAQPEYDG
ncbi:PRC-barrel domain-containing protein [Roseovarius nanhaiticus]|uniref:PRC-barrel domain-containing protein n=1 Tax=Roseovarius nanhaiticus TaxID=573024 RepID=UPI0024921D77|nr:PRC-barrel domain-containing protein [Roseovarius nanhaiticus]